MSTRAGTRAAAASGSGAGSPPAAVAANGDQATTTMAMLKQILEGQQKIQADLSNMGDRICKVETSLGEISAKLSGEIAMLRDRMTENEKKMQQLDTQMQMIYVSASTAVYASNKHQLVLHNFPHVPGEGSGPAAGSQQNPAVLSSKVLNFFKDDLDVPEIKLGVVQRMGRGQGAPIKVETAGHMQADAIKAALRRKYEQRADNDPLKKVFATAYLSREQCANYKGLRNNAGFQEAKARAPAEARVQWLAPDIARVDGTIYMAADYQVPRAER